ncbi:MAG: hypothetical protein NUV77_22460 [Thermoguttaceae bacterium]|jgi:hypothetical protein|nr:hypothetical protein [Thermoguttaceae bacterium]
MFTLTSDLILPATITGSWPRPRWFDVSMWGRPLDTCMLDVRWREKFQDALAVVINEQEPADRPEDVAAAIAQGCNIVRAELGLKTSYIPAADPALQTDIVPRAK